MRQKSKKILDESEEEQMNETANDDFQVNEIDKLQDVGINAADIAKLKASGFCTVSSILMVTKKDLANIKGITEQKIEKIQEAALKIEDGGFITGYTVMLKRKNIVRVTTGSKNLDTLLGGGIETKAITEVFGEFRSGKSQLCHTIAVTAQLPRNQGGGGGKVIFIDAEGTFRPERIIKISERFGLDSEQVLSNIVYARVYTSEFQSSLITQAAAKMMEDVFSVMIIDSIMALFRVDFSGRGELSERQQVLGKTLSKLIKLAEQFNVAVLLTNQVMSDPGSTMTFTADAKKPVGGNILAHASTTRLYFRKGKGDERVCKIYDSPCLPESDCTFKITDHGIDDADD